MPWSIDDPPPPAKNWSDEEKRKCVEAANAVLRDGGSEQNAVFACIRAAGRSTKEELETMTNARDRRRARRKAERKIEDEFGKLIEVIEVELDELNLPGLTPDDKVKVLENALKKALDSESPIEFEFLKMLDEAGDEPEVEEEISAVPDYQPFGGAQSWIELDKFLEIGEVEDSTRKALIECEAMIDNVLDDPTTDLKEKAIRISNLSQELPNRVKVVEDEKPEGLIDKLKKLFSEKAEMTRASINDLPDSDFAYVEPGGEKDDEGKTVPRSLRHYPIQDAAHIRNALARASQMMNRGGKAGDIARRALPKIRAAAKREGIGEPAKSWFKVFKDKSGSYRWFGLVTNKWRDHDLGAAPHKGGEIITEEAHKDYVEWVDKKPEKRMPYLRPWHVKELTHENRADFIDYLNGFIIASGPLTNKEAEAIKGLEKTYILGMSHGFYTGGYDNENALITKYRTFEVSYLPLEYAANPWTDFVTVEKEIEMNDDKKAFLTQLVGEDFLSEIFEETEGKAAELEEMEVESKEKEEEEVEEPEVVAPPDFKTLIDTIAKELGMEELGDFLAGLQNENKALKDEIEALKKSEDQKIAEKMKPEIDVEEEVIPIWKKRLSQSSETVVDEEKDKELIESLPNKETSWVGEAMAGTAADTGAVPK